MSQKEKKKDKTTASKGICFIVELLSLYLKTQNQSKAYNLFCDNGVQVQQSAAQRKDCVQPQTSDF